MKNLKNLKKTIKTMGFAFLIGGVCTYLFFQYVGTDLSVLSFNKESAYAFQAGVYFDLEQAQKEAAKYTSAVVIKEDEYYHVYLNITKDEEVKNIMQKYYQSNNIDVHAKKINVSKDFLKELEKYESLIKQTEESVYPKINQEILKAYEATKV